MPALRPRRAMVQYLGNVAGAVLFAADLDDFCGTVLRAYEGRDSVCSRSFPLFAKEDSREGRTNNATHADFLGNAKVQCHGQEDLYVVNKLCVQPCFADTAKSPSKCCWVPSLLAHMFDCCSALGCCVGSRPSIAAPPCVDQYPTCPKLKAQLDQRNGSCATTDVGWVTGLPQFNGLHLQDKCCASCTDYCALCMKDNTRLECKAIGVCSNCTYGAACMRCMTIAAKFTAAKCASYGIDCTEHCSSTGFGRRRRVQSASAGAQVSASVESSAVFVKLMDCLARGGKPRACIPGSRTSSPTTQPTTLTSSTHPVTGS